MVFPDVVIDFAPGFGPFDAVSYLAGTAEVADSVPTSPTGELVLSAWVLPDTWASGSDQVILSKWNATGNQRTFQWGITGTGYLYIEFSADGTATTRVESPNPVPVADGEDMYVSVQYVYSTPESFRHFAYGSDGESWFSLGTDTGTVSTPALFNSTAATIAGALTGGGSPFAGRIYRIKTAIDGDTYFTEADTILDARFDTLDAGTTTFEDHNEFDWTVNGSIVSLTQWVDLSDRAQSATWSDGKSDELSAFEPGAAAIVFANDDRALDPDNTAGPYYGTLEPRTPFRIRSTDDGGTTYVTHFVGFVETGFEQHYRPPESATCTVRLTDLLGVLAGYTLPSVYEVEVMRDRPLAYWPLDDETGEIARDISGNGYDAVYVNEPTLTDLSAGIVFGTPARVFTGNEKVTVRTGGTEPYLTCGFTTDDALTVEAWARTSMTLATSEWAPLFFQSGDIHNAAVYLTLNPTQRWGAAIINGNGTAALGSAFETVEGSYNDGVARRIACELWGSPETRLGCLWLNDVIPSLQAEVVIDHTSTSTTLAAPPVARVNYLPFIGELSHVSIYQEALPLTRHTAHYNAGAAPLSGLRSSEQIAWVLDYVGVPDSLRDLDLGAAIMGSADTKGVDALEYIRQVVATEGGGFYVDHMGGGKLRFASRYTHWLATRSTVSQATFTDDPAAPLTDARVEPDSLVVRANGIDTVTNQITVTWQGGSETIEDTASVRRWGPRGREIDSRAATAAQAIGLAQWELALVGEPRTQVVGFGIDPGAAQDAFDIARDVRINDKVTFRHQPQATGSVTIRELLVLGTDTTVDVGREWVTTYAVAAAPDTSVALFILDASELDGPDILAF